MPKKKPHNPDTWSKWAVHKCVFFISGNQEKTNTSRTSPEASSKFSTSLACMFLLQRKAPLMAPFHTWISRAEGGSAEWFITAHIKFTLLNRTGYKEMRCLWSLCLLFMWYIFRSFLGSQIHPQQCFINTRTTLKYCQAGQDGGGDVQRWNAQEIGSGKDCSSCKWTSDFFSYIGSADFS